MRKSGSSSALEDALFSSGRVEDLFATVKAVASLGINALLDEPARVDATPARGCEHARLQRVLVVVAKLVREDLELIVRVLNLVVDHFVDLLGALLAEHVGERAVLVPRRHEERVAGEARSEALTLALGGAAPQVELVPALGRLVDHGAHRSHEPALLASRDRLDDTVNQGHVVLKDNPILGLGFDELFDRAAVRKGRRELGDHVVLGRSLCLDVGRVYLALGNELRDVEFAAHDAGDDLRTLGREKQVVEKGAHVRPGLGHRDGANVKLLGLRAVHETLESRDLVLDRVTGLGVHIGVVFVRAHVLGARLALNVVGFVVERRAKRGALLHEEPRRDRHVVDLALDAVQEHVIVSLLVHGHVLVREHASGLLVDQVRGPAVRVRSRCDLGAVVESLVHLLAAWHAAVIAAAEVEQVPGGLVARVDERLNESVKVRLAVLLEQPVEERGVHKVVLHHDGVLVVALQKLLVVFVVRNEARSLLDVHLAVRRDLGLVDPRGRRGGLQQRVRRRVDRLEGGLRVLQALRERGNVDVVAGLIALLGRGALGAVLCCDVDAAVFVRRDFAEHEHALLLELHWLKSTRLKREAGNQEAETDHDNRAVGRGDGGLRCT